LDQAGTSWKEYLYTKAYDICSYVRRCLDHDVSKVVDNRQILADAAAGQLPNVSFVLPGAKGNDNSQHNGKSMAVGDDWIGQVVGALQQGPEWLSTVVFITYDDCGCFYDHTPPPAGLGIRLPMVIVSPYARPGFTDSTATPYAGMLTFVEHLFGLAPLSSTDANAYDYANSFDFSQTPLAPVRMVREHVSPEEQRALDAQPTTEFDPT
jgi:phospholipase C